MSSCDTVFLLGFVSRKSISWALIIEVGVMGGISFQEIRWQYPAVFPGLCQRCCGCCYTPSKFSFYSKRILIFPCTHFLGFRIPAESYPIRSPTGQSSSSGVSFAIQGRWSHVSAVLQVGILSFPEGCIQKYMLEVVLFLLVRSTLLFSDLIDVENWLLNFCWSLLITWLILNLH